MTGGFYVWCLERTMAYRITYGITEYIALFTILIFSQANEVIIFAILQIMDKEALQKEIDALELHMAEPDFWVDKSHAQSIIKQISELKEKLSGIGKYDKGNAVLTLFAGAGGDDAEDFASMLFRMYEKFCLRKGLMCTLLHKNENDHGGIRNSTMLVSGRGAYGILKNESGVHRLVRISPFNAKKLRHTSFALVEVIPKFEKTDASDIALPEKDLKIEFSRSGGPGGQNVNKRETAVRIVHIPTNLAVHVDTERSQEQNRALAIDLLRAKLYKKIEAERTMQVKGMQISKSTEIEWGNQIRSYVLHPYKMVKDHRTTIETSDVDGVLEEGNLDAFIEAEKDL
jgi:peptide chain release factor 2